MNCKGKPNQIKMSRSKIYSNHLFKSKASLNPLLSLLMFPRKTQTSTHRTENSPNLSRKLINLFSYQGGSISETKPKRRTTLTPHRFKNKIPLNPPFKVCTKIKLSSCLSHQNSKLRLQNKIK